MIQINMHMPQNCIECPIHDGEYGWCDLDADIAMNCDDRPDNCPLHEVTDLDTVSRQAVLRCITASRDNIDWGQSEDGDAFLHYTAALYRTIASEEYFPPSPSRPQEPQTTEWLMGGVSSIDEESAYCSKCRWAWSKKEDLDFFEYCPNCGRKILYRGKWRKVSKNESQGGAV